MEHQELVGRLKKILDFVNDKNCEDAAIDIHYLLGYFESAIETEQRTTPMPMSLSGR